MGTTFHGPNPWPHITRAIRTRGPRYVAIAYLGHLAPELLPLRAGDLLIVNASTTAIRAHATSPAVLAHYYERGVRILSSPTLHAKVIVTTRRAVIGSANASENSTFSSEAVIITDDPKVVADSRLFITNIDEITDVDEVFINNAFRDWEIGRAVPIPGITGRIQKPDNDFLPSFADRMFIRQDGSHQPDSSDSILTGRRYSTSRQSLGPTVKYRLETLRLGKPDHVARGDVIIRISADNEWLHAPALVVAEREQISLSSNGFQCILRRRNDLPMLAVSDAEQRLAEVGYSCKRLWTNHCVRSPNIRAELLALWNL